MPPDGIDLLIGIVTAHTSNFKVALYLARSMQDCFQEGLHRCGAGPAGDVPRHWDTAVLTIHNHGCVQVELHSLTSHIREGLLELCIHVALLRESTAGHCTSLYLHVIGAKCCIYQQRSLVPKLHHQLHKFWSADAQFEVCKLAILSALRGPRLWRPAGRFPGGARLQRRASVIATRRSSGRQSLGVTSC